MKPSIEFASNKTEFYIDEGCYITELSNSDSDSHLSIALARVPPGVTTRWHYLMSTEERYLILSGEGLVELDNQSPVRVKANDVVIIPAQCRQRITNVGAGELLFYALCTPRFEVGNYVEC